MTADLKKTLTVIFAPPYTYDPMAQMILDKNGQNVLDIRGYGKLQYYEDGEQRQDEFGNWVAELINREINKP